MSTRVLYLVTTHVSSVVYTQPTYRSTHLQSTYLFILTYFFVIPLSEKTRGI